MLVIWVKTLDIINLAWGFSTINELSNVKQIRPTDEGMNWYAGLLLLPAVNFFYSVTVSFWKGRKKSQNCETNLLLF